MTVLKDASGGVEKVGFIDQDCNNLIKRNRRKNNLDGDCYRLMEYFHKKQAEDSSFFWSIEIEEDMTLRSVFWADSRCRMDYAQFGDVVIFDTTYKTNTYRMPFAPFTRVNHHRQSILFGCALLADETKESFIWLFRTWLSAMSGQHPRSILTDQDNAMRKAIAEVFPQTRHRFCIWHIRKNAAEQLKHVYSAHLEFKRDYDACVEGSRSIQEFQKRWEEMIHIYNLRENTWLQKMYKRRAFWVPCFLRDSFFAGMRTTQRSESMNAFFDGYLTPTLPLNEFVLQYEKALESRHDAQEAEDHNTLYTRPKLITKSRMEVQAAEMYTRKIFTEFQKEFLEQFSLSPPKKVNVNGMEKTYEIQGGTVLFFVTFNQEDFCLRCTCQMFEFEGVPCKHMIAVWYKKGIQEIPSKYILHRWTRHAKTVPKHDLEVEDKSQILNTLMVWTIREAAHRVIDLGVMSIERYEFAISEHEKIAQMLETIGGVPTMSQSSKGMQVTDKVCNNSQISVRDRERAKPKGRPSTARWKSGLEQVQKRSRTCGVCRQIGHDMRTCKSSQVDNESFTQL